MRLLLTAAVLLCLPFSAYAQNDTDSLQSYGITPTSRADAISTLTSLVSMSANPILAGVDPPSESAATLVEICNDSPQQDTCNSYLEQHVQEIIADSRAGSWSDFCRPSDMSDGALKKIVLNFIANDPRVNQFQLSPADSVSFAFLEASKCSN